MAVFGGDALRMIVPPQPFGLSCYSVGSFKAPFFFLSMSSFVGSRRSLFFGPLDVSQHQPPLEVGVASLAWDFGPLGVFQHQPSLEVGAENGNY